MTCPNRRSVGMPISVAIPFEGLIDHDLDACLYADKATYGLVALQHYGNFVIPGLEEELHRRGFVECAIVHRDPCAFGPSLDLNGCHFVGSTAKKSLHPACMLDALRVTHFFECGRKTENLANSELNRDHGVEKTEFTNRDR